LGWFLSLAFVQAKCGGVDAIAQAGGWRAVGKYMTEMRATFFAAYFDTGHAMAVIGSRDNVFGFIRLPETRPAAAGIKLCRGIKQGVAATHTAIHSRVMAIPIHPGKGWLSAT
jgi:hypothetical protein